MGQRRPIPPTTFPPPPTAEIPAEARTCALLFTAHYERRLELDRGSVFAWTGTFITDLTTLLPHHTDTDFKFPSPVLSAATLTALRTAAIDFVITSTPQLIC